MASQGAQLCCPSSDAPDQPFASRRVPEHPPPAGEDGDDNQDSGDEETGGKEMAFPDDDDDPWAKNITYRPVSDDEETVDKETTCPGQRYTKKEERELKLKWMDEYIDMCVQYNELRKEILSRGDKNVFLPPRPFKVQPVTTLSCIKGGYCYHREYMTNDISETAPTLGSRTPQDMLQIFALRLTSTESYPISVYGTFAVRDDLEPLRNYVFNRPRDEPVIIQQGSFALPLKSPCRGVYVLDRALLEVDLWVKKEGDVSTDEKLLSVYVEIGLGSTFDKKLMGQIRNGHCMLDMEYMYLAQSVEVVIQVFAHVDKSHHVRFSAFSTCFGNEIVLFEDKHLRKGELFKHVVAVKVEENLTVRLEWENSLFEWIFKDGSVGAVSCPSDSILKQFAVRVYFAPKNGERKPSRYLAWRKQCGKI